MKAFSGIPISEYKPTSTKTRFMIIPYDNVFRPPYIMDTVLNGFRSDIENISKHLSWMEEENEYEKLYVYDFDEILLTYDCELFTILRICAYDVMYLLKTAHKKNITFDFCMPGLMNDGYLFNTEQRKKIEDLKIL